ncbi:MAG: hypothetical protein M3N98_12920 [Actinomycetota bacterium]|nr:hypothetical protein [Actinomycetota bacterium]
MHAWLVRQVFQVGHNRVARIMAEHDFVGEMGRRKMRTMIADNTATPSKDLVRRAFNPVGRDRT